MNILPSFRLDNQIAVVTGGGKGIGRGIAICLAEAGADVVVASRSKSDLDSVVAEIEARGRRALAVPTDVTVSEQIEALGERCIAELGAPTIWVNNAGGLPDATPESLPGMMQSTLPLLKSSDLEKLALLCHLLADRSAR
ncbi:MAG: 7-alpha-hydroxysteroid dehydrogenase, partial [Halioglobus sp.]